MYVVSVTVHVKPEFVERFIEAVLDNARNTRREPGNLRFDVSQAEDDPTASCCTRCITRRKTSPPTSRRPITCAGKRPSPTGWRSRVRESGTARFSSATPNRDRPYDRVRRGAERRRPRSNESDWSVRE